MLAGDAGGPCGPPALASVRQLRGTDETPEFAPAEEQAGSCQSPERLAPLGILKSGTLKRTPHRARPHASEDRRMLDPERPVLIEHRDAVLERDVARAGSVGSYTHEIQDRLLERVPAAVAKRPELKNVEPFKTVLSGDREAMAKLSLRDLEKILAATLTGMSVEDFDAEAKSWLDTARDPRWKRPYTELVYQP